MSDSANGPLTSLAGAVEAAARSVVRVEGRRRLSASGLVWSDDGAVVTANHVVERDDGVRVGLEDGRALEAAVVGRDPSTDVAVLRIAEVGLRPVDFGVDEPRVGDIALAVGRPSGDAEATLGIVTATGAGWRTRAGGLIEPYVVTDALMAPGFSGGSLADAVGRSLGMLTSALLPAPAAIVPAPTLRRVVGSLLEHGRIRRGYLGVTAQPVRLPEGDAGRLGQRGGLLVAAVEPGSPASAAGVTLGDVLLAIDGQSLHSVDDLLVALSGDRVGTSTVLRILRSGAPLELGATIAERPR